MMNSLLPPHILDAAPPPVVVPPPISVKPDVATGPEAELSASHAVALNHNLSADDNPDIAIDVLVAVPFAWADASTDTVLPAAMLNN
jgi:hypothetical protein